MTLDNLVGLSLERITPDPLTINRLLDAAKRNLQDARISQLSNENRFDTAYKAIMQMANAALQARGYRTLTSKPGHHQTMLQCLTKTLEVDLDRLIILDALRKQRNVADYSGDLVTDGAVNECLTQAEALWIIACEQLVS
ncbi:MAG: DNA-binding protein [Moraxellaceae bacterium]|nr:MAG: DNA-binding protein [Moraxellaceae bacterium]